MLDTQHFPCLNCFECNIYINSYIFNKTIIRAIHLHTQSEQAIIGNHGDTMNNFNQAQIENLTRSIQYDEACDCKWPSATNVFMAHNFWPLSVPQLISLIRISMCFFYRAKRPFELNRAKMRSDGMQCRSKLVEKPSFVQDISQAFHS